MRRWLGEGEILTATQRYRAQEYRSAMRHWSLVRVVFQREQYCTVHVIILRYIGQVVWLKYEMNHWMTTNCTGIDRLSTQGSFKVHWQPDLLMWGCWAHMRRMLISFLVARRNSSIWTWLPSSPVRSMILTANSTPVDFSTHLLTVLLTPLKGP